jgi:hypothetical protein
MQEFELHRLEEIERSAHARFVRLSGPGGVADRVVIQAAKDLGKGGRRCSCPQDCRL